jgi:hypothetical protein
MLYSHLVEIYDAALSGLLGRHWVLLEHSDSVGALFIMVIT